MINKPSLLETIRTAWPIFLFLVAGIIWAVTISSVSNAEFSALEIRVAVIEERVPTQDIMIQIHDRLARMEGKLETLSQYILKK